MAQGTGLVRALGEHSGFSAGERAGTSGFESGLGERSTETSETGRRRGGRVPESLWSRGRSAHLYTATKNMNTTTSATGTNLPRLPDTDMGCSVPRPPPPPPPRDPGRFKSAGLGC